MIRRTPVPDGLRELARHQAGVISREQMLAFGLSDRVASRLVRQEIWRRVTPGLMALSDETWLQLAWAGVLLGGSAAILGGRTAAHLWGIERDPPTQITVFVGRERRIARDDRWRFVRSDRLGVGDPPRTRLPQTIVDLAPSLNPDQLTSLLADVVGSNRVRPGDILRVVRQTPRLPNRKLLCDLLGDVAAGVDSPLELRYLRDVERAHGLPRAARRERPAHRFRSDAWYREYGVIVELDGALYHRGLARSTDMTRDNLHRLSGLITLRFAWTRVVGDPCGVARQVAAALSLNRWPGPLHSCPRC